MWIMRFSRCIWSHRLDVFPAICFGQLTAEGVVQDGVAAAEAAQPSLLEGNAASAAEEAQPSVSTILTLDPEEAVVATGGLGS